MLKTPNEQRKILAKAVLAGLEANGLPTDFAWPRQQPSDPCLILVRGDDSYFQIKVSRIR